MKRLTIVLGLVLVATAGCGDSESNGGTGGGYGADSNWRMFGHDIANTRSNTVETEIGVDTVGDLELLWAHVGSQVTTTPAVVDGIVYFADWSGNVYAREALTGEEVWTERPGGVGMSPSLTVIGDRIFGGNFAAFIVAFSRLDGSVIW